jgi:hypothetical protein
MLIKRLTILLVKTHIKCLGVYILCILKWCNRQVLINNLILKVNIFMQLKTKFCYASGYF